MKQVLLAVSILSVFQFTACSDSKNTDSSLHQTLVAEHKSMEEAHEALENDHRALEASHDSLKKEHKAFLRANPSLKTDTTHPPWNPATLSCCRSTMPL